MSDLRKIFESTDFWCELWNKKLTPRDPMWGVQKEMKFDLLTSQKSLHELAEWYAGLFRTSNVFDPDTGVEDFIGIEKEVKGFLLEQKG